MSGRDRGGGSRVGGSINGDVVRKGGGVALMEDMSGSEDRGDKDKAEQREGDAGIVVCGDGVLVGGVVGVIIGCPSRAIAVEGAVETVL